MQDMLARLVDLPLARVFLLAGIIFLLVAVLGRIEGKLQPGTAGRLAGKIALGENKSGPAGPPLFAAAIKNTAGGPPDPLSRFP